MIKLLLVILTTINISACAAINTAAVVAGKDPFADAHIAKSLVLNRPENQLPLPKQGPIVVAVYSFPDKTGQRADMATVASFSTAVTQGADAFLIKALTDVGNGQWFRVIERVAMDDLVKERQVIRSTREIYQGKNAQPVDPLLFAGILIEGGIIGYDSNTQTGGLGARWLGINGSTQWRQDTVTINLRAVSVSNGEVLVNVTVSKSIMSYMDDVGILKFLDAGTRALEGEIGSAINESRNIAITSAIETGVVELVRQGQRKGLWQYAN